MLQRLSSVLAVLAVVSVMIAAVTPRSRTKGRLRLAGSLLIGTAFVVGSLCQALIEAKLWLGLVGVSAGLFLGWVGMRKYRRDPEGRTRASKILYLRADCGQLVPSSSVRQQAIPSPAPRVGLVTSSAWTFGPPNENWVER